MTKKAVKSTPAKKTAKAPGVEALRKDVAVLKADAKVVLDDIKVVAHDGRRSALRKGKRLAKSAGSRFEDANHAMKSTVRDKPMRAIGASFAAGWLLGALRRK
ncbi:MAG: hypothetical protein IPK75_17415 [Acidobacteria bacterium]|jgi:ElaB/YqjD/DUF883 family membrane-anchored ribosome-binding protein|nr:hypothetical protein [Acidobacteriota bacterium]